MMCKKKLIFTINCIFGTVYDENNFKHINFIVFLMSL